MAAKRTLVVVESPAKAKTIGKYLGNGYTVKATVGHIRDLPERELGVDIEAHFKPKFVTVKGKQKAIAELKSAAKEADAILIATDPDREGEAIAWHVKEQVGRHAGSVQRVLFHEITKDAIRAAIAHPVTIDGRKVEAQLARRILDRLVGFKVSPLLWKAIKTGLSAGRVQTVALRLIVEREQEIGAFVPREYWTVAAHLEKDGQAFEAELHKLGGHKPEIPNGAEALAIVEAVRGRPFIVTDVRRKERRKRPPAPFTTSTLQQEAAKRLGYSSKRTMQIAQGLYEGVEVGDEGAVGLITYMRTDSTRVAASAVASARAYIAEQFPKTYLPDAPNYYGGANAQAQDAHEAVRPTDVARTPDAMKRWLKADQLKLYQLIWQRFVASQMAPIVYDTTTVDFDLGQYLFRATGSVILFDGYHRLYHEAREQGEGRTLEDLAPLPPLEVGDTVALRDVVPTQHFTEPPPRFSEASLVKELEKLGIGRPSTYAQISSTLLARHYVQMLEKRFHPTDLGGTVNRLLVPRFPDIFNVEFTSAMETELDRIEGGELSRVQVLGDFWTPFEKRLAAVKPEEMIGEAHDLSKIAEERCPQCGSPVTVKTGRFGPYIACTKQNDPECTYTLSLRKRGRAPDRPTGEACEKCGKPMVIKHGRFGEFMACTGYPACRNTKPVPLGVKCPQCGTGDLAEKRARKGGRKFYGCNRYPACDFTAWNRPVAETCASCGNVGLEVKETKTKGTFKKCLKCGTEFAEAEAAAPALA
jgi:DNA topoisomerase-1